MKYQEWQWNDTYLTHQETIDYQHKTLFNTINDLVRACNESDEPNGLLVEVALDELLKYAAHHFADEENLMAAHHYEGLAEQQQQHKNFVEMMLKFKARFDHKENISGELLSFMQKWLVDHILTKDKKAMEACR